MQCQDNLQSLGVIKTTFGKELLLINSYIVSNELQTLVCFELI